MAPPGLGTQAAVVNLLATGAFLPNLFLDWGISPQLISLLGHFSPTYSSTGAFLPNLFLDWGISPQLIPRLGHFSPTYSSTGAFLPNLFLDWGISPQPILGSRARRGLPRRGLSIRSPDEQLRARAAPTWGAQTTNSGVGVERTRCNRFSYIPI